MTTLQRPQKEMNTKFLSLLHSGTIDPNSFHIFKSYTEFGFEYLSIPMIEWQAFQKKRKCKENLNLYGFTIQLLFESLFKVEKNCKNLQKTNLVELQSINHPDSDLSFVFASFATQY